MAYLPCLAAHQVDQAIDLSPGWNAIYLEVEPITNTPSAVFDGTAVSSVWTWVPHRDAYQFVQNMSETLHADPHWLVHFPTNRYESMFNDLHRLFANRCYLLHVNGTNDLSLTVSGRPAVPRMDWAPNRLNFAGFALDPAAAQPSLYDFFKPSPAFDGQVIYRLSPAGLWESVADPAAAAAKSGECFWIHAATASDYIGPVNVRVDAGDGLEYGDTLTERNLWIENRSSNRTSVLVDDLSGPGPVGCWSVDTNAATVAWAPLPLALDLPAGGKRTVRLAVRREAMVSDRFETTIRVRSDLGGRVFVPLSAEK